MPKYGIMTTDEFNKKWFNHLENGHYGMDIGYSEVIEYMDKEFTKEAKINPNFTYAQIKLKFGTARVYTSSRKWQEWESHIDKLLKDKK